MNLTPIDNNNTIMNIFLMKLKGPGALLLFLGMLLAHVPLSAQNGKIKGKVVDGEGVPMAKIQLLKEDNFYKGTYSDQDGNYEFALLDAGEYTVEVEYDGKKRTQKLTLAAGATEYVDLKFYVQGKTEVIYDKLVTVDPMVITTLDHHDIAHMPTDRSIGSTIAVAGGLYQPDSGDPLSLRGGRSGATVTFVDGVKMVGPAGVPQPAIGTLSLISGGIPAEYGDVTGGIIVVTTRNPGMRGFKGKPLTRSQKKELKERRKRARKGSDTLLDGTTSGQA